MSLVVVVEVLKVRHTSFEEACLEDRHREEVAGVAAHSHCNLANSSSTHIKEGHSDIYLLGEVPTYSLEGAPNSVI